MAAIETVAIQSQAGNSANSGTGWRAYVTAIIRNISGDASVANATVSGSLSPGGTVSCSTSSIGSCTMNSAVISRSTSLTIMTATNVSGTNLTYDSSQNSATQISVAKAWAQNVPTLSRSESIMASNPAPVVAI